MKILSSDSYHHGDLKSALITAAVTLIREGGVEGFSLRKAAKHAGVTPGASAHHFKGVRELLTAVAIQAYGELKVSLDLVPVTGKAGQDLRAQANAYVTFAATHPGLFQLICRVDLVDYNDMSLASTSIAAMSNFGKAAAAYYQDDDYNPELHEIRPGVTGAVATAHGLAHLVVEGRPSLVFMTPEPQVTFLNETLPTILNTLWPDKS